MLQPVLPLRNALGDDSRRLRRFLAQAHIAFDLALDANAFLPHEVAQPLELADQAVDFRDRRDGDALHDARRHLRSRLRWPLAIEGRVAARKFLHRPFARVTLSAFVSLRRTITPAPSRRKIDHQLTPTSDRDWSPSTDAEHRLQLECPRREPRRLYGSCVNPTEIQAVTGLHDDPQPPSRRTEIV